MEERERRKMGGGELRETVGQRELGSRGEMRRGWRGGFEEREKEGGERGGRGEEESEGRKMGGRERRETVRRGEVEVKERGGEVGRRIRGEREG